MLKDVPFGMELRRLCAAFHRLELGQDLFHQTAGLEKVPAARSMGRKENPYQLIPNSLGADFTDCAGCPHDRFPGCRFDFKIEHSGEANRAQKPQPVFGEALRRVANRSYETGLEVLASARRNRSRRR